MSDPVVDPERIAALLDGRLDSAAREALLADLAASNISFEIFAEAAEIQRELETATLRPVERLPMPLSRHRRASLTAWRWRLPLAIAAIALIALTLRSISGRRAPSRDPVMAMVSLLDDSTTAAQTPRVPTGLPPDWNGHLWSTTRGPAAPLAPGERSARLGAALVDLQLLVSSHDTVESALTANAIAELLDGIPASSPVSSLFRQMAARSNSSPGQLDPLLREGRITVLQLADSASFELAAWTEAARVASARGIGSFFQAKTSRQLLDQAANAPELSEPVRQVIGRVRNELVGQQIDWTRLGDELRVLLEALGDPSTQHT